MVVCGCGEEAEEAAEADAAAGSGPGDVHDRQEEVGRFSACSGSSGFGPALPEPEAAPENDQHGRRKVFGDG